jgi:hypothetical protein
MVFKTLHDNTFIKKRKKAKIVEKTKVDENILDYDAYLSIMNQPTNIEKIVISRPKGKY